MPEIIDLNGAWQKVSGVVIAIAIDGTHTGICYKLRTLTDYCIWPFIGG